jgi:cell cycle checkpoint protein
MAPTFMIKALKRIAASAFTDVKSRPSQEFIQLIAHSANGDLRSAINSLQFLSRSGNSRNAITSTSNALVSGKKTGKGSRGGKGTKLKGSEEVRTLYVTWFLSNASRTTKMTRGRTNDPLTF